MNSEQQVQVGDVIKGPMASWWEVIALDERSVRLEAATGRILRLETTIVEARIENGDFQLCESDGGDYRA